MSAAGVSVAIHAWPSEALKNRCDGTIVALGANLDEARSTARRAFLAYLREEDRYMRRDDGSFYDESDQEDYEERMAKFEADIAKTPIILDSLCIRGSD